MTEGRQHKVIVNADDYGMDGGVDAAVLDLAERGAVTSASALVLFPGWQAAGKALARVPISRGLHLDFTSEHSELGYSERSVSDITVRAYCRLLDPQAISRTMAHQLALYEDAMSAPPDFVDGHRHLHQLPIIRDQLVACLEQRYGDMAKTIRLRSCRARAWRGIEAAFVSGTGSHALERLARKAKLAVNSDFAGVYGFSGRSDLKRLWQRWLGGLEGATPIVMCHPAKARPDVPSDPIRQARIREYEWFCNREFRAVCERAGVTPAPWS